MRVIKCDKCGESGVLAGGLHKVGDGKYRCNKRDVCEEIVIQKGQIMLSKKELKK